MQRLICQYCGKDAEYVDSAEIYGKSYGMMYLCRPCKAYCGVHKGTDKPLGTLANESLRSWRKMAHKAFDEFWIHSTSRRSTRKFMYGRLARVMGIQEDDCHIGMFDELRCREVIRIAEEWRAQDA